MSHTHVIDGRIVTYPNDKCPICHPEKFATQNEQQKLPRVYRKGNTIIIQISKGIMSTTTWWEKGDCFLHTVRKMARDKDGKVLRDGQNKPIWNELVMRMSISVAKQYIAELSGMINELESATYKTADNKEVSTVPKRE